MAFPPWWAKSEMSGNLFLFFFSFLLFFLRGPSKRARRFRRIRSDQNCSPVSRNRHLVLMVCVPIVQPTRCRYTVVHRAADIASHTIARKRLTERLAQICRSQG